MKRKQSVRNGVWYIGGRRRSRRGQKGGFLPIAGLLCSVAASLIGEIAKSILRKTVNGRRCCPRYAKTKNYIKKTHNATESMITKWTILCCKI